MEVLRPAMPEEGSELRRRLKGLGEIKGVMELEFFVGFFFRSGGEGEERDRAVIWEGILR